MRYYKNYKPNLTDRKPMMNQLNDYRLQLGKDEYKPIMIGGMGVDISTSEMALEGARLGGIAHLSDAMICAVSDRYFDTSLVKSRFQKYKHLISQTNKSEAQFDLNEVRLAMKQMVGSTMDQKTGSGGIFINLMEKLTMNNPKETLAARLIGALDGGVDGVSLGAGLHLGSFDMIKDHPRFRDAKLGIIVSSVRALNLFLKRSARLKRHPDFIVVEGPLAGGHLGFGIDDWKTFDLKTITTEVMAFLKKEELKIPVIPAGGIFSGSDAVDMVNIGASAIQVATRFTVTRESGLPAKVKQKYFQANEDDIIVNQVSPTGYPMRMLSNSPCVGAGVRPNCESFGYILDRNGDCAYIEAYQREVDKGAEKISVMDKTCLCSQMRNYNTWTCGHYTYRLKETTQFMPNGEYRELTVEDVFNDYLYSTDHQINSTHKMAIGN